MAGKLTKLPRPSRGWALFTPQGWVFNSSVRILRSQVVDFANNDAVPGWDWKRYRKSGFFIAKVDIIPASREDKP